MSGDVMLRKLVYILVGLLGLSLGLSACSSAESTRSRSEGDDGAVPPGGATVVERADPRAETGPPSDVVARLIQKALQSDGSVSYKTLVRRLGTPQTIEIEPVRNQYVRGKVDTLRTLVYPGIEALVYDVTNEAKTFLVRLSLSSTQYATPEGLRVGLSKQHVLDELGPPTRRNPSKGELIYQETEPTPTSMVVQFRNGRIVRIDWEFYFT